MVLGRIVQGPHVSRLLTAIGKFAKSRYVFGFNSGREALQAALIAADIGPGDRVILPSYCCDTVVQAVMAVSATPVYCDIGPDLNPDTESVMALLNPQVKAIVFTHLFGNPGRIDLLDAELRRQGWRSHVLLIDDAAQSFGARLGGKLIGTLGDVGVVSFGAGKTMTATGGGVLITGSSALATRLERMPTRLVSTSTKLRLALYWFLFRRWRRLALGFWRAVRPLFKTSETVGDVPAGLCNLDAAITLEQLRRLEQLLAIRRQRMNELDRVLNVNSGQSFADPVPPVAGRQEGAVCTKYALILRPTTPGPDDAYRYLAYMRECGIELQPLYEPIHRRRPSPIAGRLGRTEQIADRVIQIPVEPSLSDRSFAYVVRCFLAYPGRPAGRSPMLSTRERQEQRGQSSGVTAKAKKAREIAGFYRRRWFGLPSAPKINNGFATALRTPDGAFLSLLLAQDQKNTIRTADRICDGAVKLHGLPHEVFKQDPSWRKDFYSGYEWPLRPINRIYDSNDSGVDLNIPFELSRLQHVPALIQAYQVTHDHRYVHQLAATLDSWIRANPYGFGPNWWSCMEVGLRAVNMALACAFLQGHVEEHQWNRFLQSLWMHACHIHEYDVVRDPTRNKNNHFLGAMLGLLAVALIFDGLQAAEYRQTALGALRREVLRQFHDDGGNFESATAYHQFSMEVALVALLLLLSGGPIGRGAPSAEVLLGEEAVHRLRKGLQLTADYIQAFGESPNIGDSSDCRVLVFKDYFNRRSLDHRFLLELGAHVLDWSIPESRPGLASVYPTSGYACLKSKRYGLVAWAGPKGSGGSGGHGHNDKCSFVLAVDNRPLLVDSGTFIYNPNTQSRYALKRGRAHNILMLDDVEQCPIAPERVFGLGGEIRPSVAIKDRAGTWQIDMTHDGYARIETLGEVHRTIKCEGDTLLIHDRASGKGSHLASLFLNLHPEVQATIDASVATLRISTLKATIEFPHGVSLSFEDSQYSSMYHERGSSKRLVASMVAELPLSLAWTIRVLEEAQAR